MFGIPPVAAHIPFADGTRFARHRVGTPNDAHSQVAGSKAAIGRRIEHTGKRFVPENEALLARRRRPVESGQNLPVGATDADSDRFDEYRAVALQRFWNLVKSRAAVPARHHINGTHHVSIVASESRAALQPVHRLCPNESRLRPIRIPRPPHSAAVVRCRASRVRRLTK
jgi:hypothetical protein